MVGSCIDPLSGRRNVIWHSSVQFSSSTTKPAVALRVGLLQIRFGEKRCSTGSGSSARGVLPLQFLNCGTTTAGDR